MKYKKKFKENPESKFNAKIKDDIPLLVIAGIILMGLVWTHLS